jgi:uncharacterized protein (DUF433 family)
VSTYVSVQPGMKSGVPCIAGRRLPTELIASMYVAEGGWEVVADRYEITRDDVMVACWFEARYGRSKRRRKAWAGWLADVEGRLWESQDWTDVPFPPRDAA